MKLKLLTFFASIVWAEISLLGQFGYGVIGEPLSATRPSQNISGTIGQTGFRTFANDDIIWQEGVQQVYEEDGINPTLEGSYDILLTYGEKMSLDILSDKTKYPYAAIFIFNRWGQEVFRESPYQNDWSGTNTEGQSLNDGAYFFILTLDDKGQNIILGSVTLIR